jgi:hypothetical protein
LYSLADSVSWEKPKKRKQKPIMEINKRDEMLQERGFMPEEIESLRQLRCIYEKRELVDITKEIRRLEFARWLVSTGRLTDGEPETNPC